MFNAEGALFFDWDYFAGNFASLREYLFEHGTIPLANFYLCGGKPELGNPQSYAYTWPSLFAYLFRPNVAILALCVFLMACGAVFTWRLLFRWSASRIGATAGTSVYLLSGYCLSHFRVGHVTFSFCHLVPWLISLYDEAFEASLRGAFWGRSAIWLLIASFLFLTSGLPHPFMYFYPAFLLFVVFRFVHGVLSAGGWAALRASVAGLSAHAMGFWLAMYKFWPVLIYQTRHPRQGLFDETHSVAELAGYLASPHPANHEADAAIGLAACAIGAALALASVARFGFPKALHSDDRRWARAGYGIALVVAGTLMSFGNANPASPAYYLKKTFFGSIRFYSRYQLVTVLGFAILCALAIGLVESRFATRWARLVAGGVLGALVMIPVGRNLLVEVPWALATTPVEEIVKQTGITGKIPTPVYLTRIMAADAYTVEHGYWIPNCYEAIAVPIPNLPYNEKAQVLPITRPPPVQVKELGASHVTFEYAEDLAGTRILASLANYSGYVDANASVIHTGDGVIIQRELTGGRNLTVSYVFPGNRDGLLMSLSAAALLAVIGLAVRMRRPVSDPV